MQVKCGCDPRAAGLIPAAETLCQAEAVRWGAALGAKKKNLGAYKGHGRVAHPHGGLITWATITEGGIQVNANGDCFWNEAQGYSVPSYPSPAVWRGW